MNSFFHIRKKNSHNTYKYEYAKNKWAKDQFIDSNSNSNLKWSTYENNIFRMVIAVDSLVALIIFVMF